MNDPVPHTSHVLPWNVGVLLTKAHRQSLCGLADDFQCSDHCKVDAKISLKLIVGNVFQKDLGLVHRLAAHALGLDFVPLEQERYDLVIPRAFYESDLLQPMLDVMRDQAFREAVMALPGYDAGKSGEVVEE